ncbi:MAG: 4-hydroxyphenylpyruvate dioxygenase [Armatimonadetes bacterium]|nr:4-hydroxyphenylpyruvate dioxygenase [Armatimonadota bacterium]
MELKTTAEAADQAARDFLPLRGIHHVELWVGNARQASYFYQKLMGFEMVAYSGPETGVRDRACYVMQQGRIRLVLTTPLVPHTEMAEHVQLHGDGVKVIALQVDDAAKALHETTARGARALEEPREVSDEKGKVVISSIAAYGDTIHRFVEASDYSGIFLPGFAEQRRPGENFGLAAIDHIVGNVELGEMNTWVDYYARVMGFSQLLHFDDQDISTEYSALMSKVMQDGTGKIKFPINEPAEGRRKSQIEEYLEWYRGPGVQHIALLTGDIVSTVTAMKEAGLEFLPIPDSYYEMIPERVSGIKEKLEDLKRLGILVDRDEEGYLLQIFTRPVEDRPTLFYEIIQRRGSRGFGKGNFKALFEAIEREQARRGNL